MITIDTDVPPPPHAGRWPAKKQYATPTRAQFLVMEPGNSVFFEGGERERGRVSTALNKLKKTGHRDRVFTMRKVEGGYRVWRLT